MEPKTYRPKPSPTTIEAVQLTEENADEVARWCFGEVMEQRVKGKPGSFVGVRFQKPNGMIGAFNYVTAYPGDYVVKTGTNGPFNFTAIEADTIRYKYEEVTA